MLEMTKEEKMDFGTWAIRLSWEQYVLERNDADWNDRLTFWSSSLWKCVPHIAYKKEKGEIQIIADVYSKYVRSQINCGQML